MRQNVTNTHKNINTDQTTLERVQELLLRLWTTILSHVRQIKPAAIAIALFLAVVFTFAVKDDSKGQGLAMATLPVKAEAVEAPRAKTPSVDYKVGAELERMKPLPPQTIDSETLWLARGIYSETKRPQEQELVAWTIRNRVETGYRGNSSYEEAVLDPYQYSAFIKGTPTRAHYGSLQADSKEPGFQTAVAIARQVKQAPDSLRPFSKTTRHFYSEQSMVGGRTPDWAEGKSPVKPERPIELDAKRFRFYENIG